MRLSILFALCLFVPQSVEHELIESTAYCNLMYYHSYQILYIGTSRSSEADLSVMLDIPV